MCNSFAIGFIVNYNSELFPASIRGFTLGLALFMGRLLMSVFPFMNSLLDSFDLHRLTCLIPFTFVTMMLCYKLPETFKKSLN